MGSGTDADGGSADHSPLLGGGAEAGSAGPASQPPASSASVRGSEADAGDPTKKADLEMYGPWPVLASGTERELQTEGRLASQSARAGSLMPAPQGMRPQITYLERVVHAELKGEKNTLASTQKSAASAAQPQEEIDMLLQKLQKEMEEYVEKRRNEQGEDLEALKSVQSGLETQMTKVEADLVHLRSVLVGLNERAAAMQLDVGR